MDVEDYIEIFRKAHSFLSPNGVIAAISAESTTDSGRKEPYGDVARLESLCKRLTEEAGILFSCRYHFVSEGNHQFDYGFACIQKTL
ncbi:MAG: hypothetical protein KKE20_01395 [Nanoarchaeota archaeon]|nr:hypothetical protein [Nanoarchaeota archaeon]